MKTRAFSELLTARPDFYAMVAWLRPHSHILDLGCGNGELLAALHTELNVRGYGIEISDEKVLACLHRGVNVIQQNLEQGLALFEDQSFDFVILSQTLQTIHRTEYLLREIVRVGKECIISFPNFARWSHRLTVLCGRMPVSPSLPYEWYETPNVRTLTIADFEALASRLGLVILDRVVLNKGYTVQYLPNLFGDLAVYRIQRI